MTISNIFKMEFFRNFRDKAYLLVIGILTVLFAVATVVGIVLMKVGAAEQGPSMAILLGFEILFALSLFLALALFSVIYPWHLLSTDYNNRVLSLVVASGVARKNYYFVKVIATILTNLLAYVVIGLIPVVLLLGFFQREFVDTMQEVVRGFSGTQAFLGLLGLIFSTIATMVMLYFVVILTRGKFWGIFVFLGIRLMLGVVIGTILPSMFTTVFLSMARSTTGVGNNTVSLVVSLVEILVFGFLGYLLLKRQDL